MIGAILLALATPVTPGPDCAAARAAVPEARACVEGPNGIAVAADEAAARAFLAEAQIGEQRFRDTFGREPARYALFSFDDQAVGRTAIAALRKLGFRVVQPLASPALLERQMADMMRRFQPSGVGGVAPRLVRREGASGVGGGGEPRGENHIVHELGHQWYTAAFWWEAASPAPPAPPRYGSAAPDWLDEAAAMLMENDSGVQGYHQKFADGRSADAMRAAATAPEIPLAELTSMTHPAMVSIRTPSAAGGPVISFATGRPTLFYSQVRVFADYLAERSGNPRVLAVVSEGLSDGTAFDDWLRSHGAKHRLPPSLVAMQPDWDAWLDRRFGAAPAGQ